MRTKKVLCTAIAAMICIGAGNMAVSVKAEEMTTTAILQTVNASVKMGGEYGTDVWYDVAFDADELFYLVNNKPTAKGITLQYSLTEEAHDGDIIGSTRMVDHLLQPEGYNAWASCNTVGLIDFQTRGGWGDRSVTYGKEATFVYDAESHKRTINGNAGGYLLNYNIGELENLNVNDAVAGLGAVKDGEEYSIYSYMDLVKGAQYFGLATDSGTYSASGKYWCFDSDNNSLGLTLCIGMGVSELTTFTDVTAVAGKTVWISPDEKTGFDVTGLKNAVTGEAIAATEKDGVWSFTMPASGITVEPVYQARPHSVSLETCENGALEAPDSIRAGETLKISVKPDVGYELDVLYVNGQSVSVAVVNGEYSFTAEDTDYILSASFKKIIANISWAAGIRITPAEEREEWFYGDDYAFTVSAEEGYTLGDGYKVFCGDREAELKSDGYWHIELTKENKMEADKLSVSIYTVTFDSDGGSAVESQKVEYGKKAVAPETPVREGYTFKGWVLNGEEFDFDWIITENISLKAEWEVSVNSEGKEEDPSGCGSTAGLGTLACMLIFAGGFLLRKRR